MDKLRTYRFDFDNGARQVEEDAANHSWIVVDKDGNPYHSWKTAEEAQRFADRMRGAHVQEVTEHWVSPTWGVVNDGEGVVLDERAAGEPKDVKTFTAMRLVSAPGVEVATAPGRWSRFWSACKRFVLRILGRKP